MTLSGLIAKLEAAEEGSRDLDIDVYVTLAQTIHPEAVYTEGDDVFVADVYEDGLPVCYGLASDNAPHYSTSLDAALPWENIVYSNITAPDDDGEQLWRALHSGNDGIAKGFARTEPLARRVAALKAKEAES